MEKKKKTLEGFAEGKNVSLLEARDLDTCTLSVRALLLKRGCDLFFII